jgi:hypothetical protein
MAHTWLVTTAHSPAGRKLAKRLLENGDEVITTARNPLMLEDLKTAHATRLTIYTANDADSVELAQAVDQAFAEHKPIDVVVGRGSLALAAFPHLVEQGGGRIIQSPGADSTGATVTITAAQGRTIDLNSWVETTVAGSHGNETSLSEEQLRRLQPGMWGQPPQLTTDRQRQGLPA